MLIPSHASWPFQDDWYVIDLVKEYTNVDFNLSLIHISRSAFFARTHSVGPIFPPAPSTRIAPSNLPSSTLSASLGVVSILLDVYKRQV